MYAKTFITLTCNRFFLAITTCGFQQKYFIIWYIIYNFIYLLLTYIKMFTLSCYIFFLAITVCYFQEEYLLIRDNLYCYVISWAIKTFAATYCYFNLTSIHYFMQCMQHSKFCNYIFMYFIFFKLNASVHACCMCVCCKLYAFSCMKDSCMFQVCKYVGNLSVWTYPRNIFFSNV